MVAGAGYEFQKLYAGGKSAGGEVLVAVADVDGAPLLVEDAQLEFAAVMVEIAHEQRVQAAPHGMLAYEFTW